MRVPDLVLHAAAWTDVDGAESEPQDAAAVNVGGTQNVASLGAPLVYYSIDPAYSVPASLAVAPGEGFGAQGEGWARISLATPDERLDAGR